MLYAASYILKASALLFAVLVLCLVLTIIYFFVSGVVRSIRADRALSKAKQDAYEQFEKKLEQRILQDIQAMVASVPIADEVEDVESYAAEGIEEIQATLLDHPFNLKGNMDEDRDTGTQS